VSLTKVDTTEARRLLAKAERAITLGFVPNGHAYATMAQAALAIAAAEAANKMLEVIDADRTGHDTWGDAGYVPGGVGR